MRKSFAQRRESVIPASIDEAAVSKSALKYQRSALPEHPLGSRIATLRRAKGLTLTSLSDICGFSEATLSRIENGQTHVSAHHLFIMAQHLGVDIADFFHSDTEPLMKGMRSITRKGEAEEHRMSRYVSEVLNADLSRKGMHPAINHISARSVDDAGGLSSHSGEEFLYVVGGSIAIHTDLYTPTQLFTGDSIYFEGSMPHAYINVGTETTATILVVVGPSTGHPS